VLSAPPAAPEVLTAPAGSPVATQMLNGVAAGLQAQLAQRIAAAGGDPARVKIAVTPVVPLSSNDPAGIGLATASFPLAMGGMVGGVLIFVLVFGLGQRLVALVGFAAATGLVMALILQTWFQFLQGDFWLNALAIGVSVLATSSLLVGCGALLGPAGIGVGALITMLIGNPISSAAAPWQFLAEPWGALGQLFVPGASNWLVRSLSYFPDADVSAQWGILLGWTALGVLLAVLGEFRRRSSAAGAS
jgi:hypothetical protein